jgi:hypothetical protein
MRALSGFNFEDVIRRETDIADVGSLTVISRADLVNYQEWQSAFSLQRKDRRYYEIVEDTLHPEFVYRYVVVKDGAGVTRSIQPCFVLDLDLAAGVRGSIAVLIDIVRQLWPRFMRVRTLMLGCAAGEGHLGASDEVSRKTIARILAVSIIQEARLQNAKLIVFKEIPAVYRESLDCLRHNGYCRVPSLPAVRLNIDYPSFDDYMSRALSGNTRAHLRRNLRASERPPAIELDVIDDISPFIDEAYPLYLEVYERSNIRFEKLTKEYFCSLGRRMSDKVRFFLWRRGGRLVAFSTCMFEGDTFCAEYLGLDYTVALDLHLYFRVFHDEVSWAMAKGYRWYRSGPVQYHPKLHLRFRLEPLDLYVRHTSRIFNAVLALLLPLIEPTRYDPILPQFPNYPELWGEEASRPTAQAPAKPVT